MKYRNIFSTLSLVVLLNVGIGSITAIPSVLASSLPEQQVAPEKGPHNGRMLHDGNFSLELSIFETGVPPEFRVWITQDGKKVDLESVTLNVKLVRLGNIVDDINFYVQDDFLRGDMEIYEPHSFVVRINATYQGISHHWEYDNFEGRTTIAQSMAEVMDIKTAIAGPATLHQTIPAYGTLALPPQAKYSISARFDGEIKQLHVAMGDAVRKGQKLVTVESNESLSAYNINAPSAGIITEQFANTGEQTKGRTLLTLTDTRSYIAKLAIYPSDYQRISIGSKVHLKVEGADEQYTGEVSYIEPTVRADQARILWVALPAHNFKEGSFVKAQIEVANIDVPLAVKRLALQSFRDFTVVYAKVGEQYEVRMLTLGRMDDEWVEVLGGLSPGTEYVSQNSYILKADIEKSGASHDH